MNKIQKFIWIHYSFFHKLNLRDKFFRKFLARRFQKILVLNKTDFKKYSELFPNLIEYIPNPVSFYSNERSTLNNKTMIAVGRIDKIKGFDLLIKAFSKIVHQHHVLNWKLNIIGSDGGEKKYLNQLIKDLDVEKRVFIKDAVNNIKEEYLCSDIYVMTSINECFGLVLLEAQEADSQ